MCSGTDALKWSVCVPNFPVMGLEKRGNVKLFSQEDLKDLKVLDVEIEVG